MASAKYQGGGLTLIYSVDTTALNVTGGALGLGGTALGWDSAAKRLIVGATSDLTGGAYTRSIQAGETTNPGNLSVARPTASAVAATVLGQLSIFNGTTEVGRIEGQSAGATDSGRLYIYRKTTSAGIVAQVKLTETSSILSSPDGTSTSFTASNSGAGMDYGGTTQVVVNSSGVTVGGVAAGITLVNTGNAPIMAYTSNTLRLTISGAGLFTVWDGGNIALGTTTGTKIGTATNQKLSFFNSTPIVQPTVTGSRGANAALASLCTQLAALGLIVDSTS